MDYKIIAVDFDGTLCFSNWPELGEPNTRLIQYLQAQQAAGNKIILWTCRAGDAEQAMPCLLLLIGVLSRGFVLMLLMTIYLRLWSSTVTIPEK